MSSICPACGGLTHDWPRPACESPINHDIWDLPETRHLPPASSTEAAS